MYKRVNLHGLIAKDKLVVARDELKYKRVEHWFAHQSPDRKTTEKRSHSINLPNPM